MIPKIVNLAEIMIHKPTVMMYNSGILALYIATPHTDYSGTAYSHTPTDHPGTAYSHTFTDHSTTVSHTPEYESLQKL